MHGTHELCFKDDIHHCHNDNLFENKLRRATRRAPRRATRRYVHTGLCGVYI